MRTLSSTLEKAQQAGTLNPLYRIVLTKGATTYTYEKDRILPSEHDEEMYSHQAKIVLDNADGELNDLDLKGYDAVISYGFGSEYSATAALSVIDQTFNSDPNNLTCTLEVEGIPNLMAQDEASQNYVPEADDTKVVKTLIREIAGDTGVTMLTCFNHCHKYDVVWDVGYDTLADTYKPKDGFRVYTGGSRLAALRRVLDYTANVPRFEADGKIHILKPVTSGTTYDSEYSLDRGAHTFFSKAYKNSLVFPNRIVITSRPDDDPQYSGSAQIDGYSSLPDSVKKTKYIQARLESNAQAEDIAEALIAKAEMGCSRGQAEAPLNCGAEVFDYVKVTDSRQGDTRTGNLGYVHRRFGQDKWTMTFGFGNWFEWLKYQKMLKELETYSDEGSYFSRLKVGSLYATLDEITDGPDLYVRQKSLQLNASGVFIAEDTLYTLRVPGGPQHKLTKSTTAPTSPTSGDFWIDTNYEPNPLKMWNGTSWVSLTAAEVAEFNRGTIYRELKSVALTADGLVILDQVQVGTYGLVKSASLSADGLVLLDQVQDGTYGKLLATQISAGKIYISSANDFATGYDPSGKSKVFRQASAPTAETIGDLWVDTDDANKLYRWSGTSWVSIRDSDISQALQDAAEAYAYADDAYDLAGGKAKTFRQTSAPTSGMQAGDLWIDTDAGNKPYIYSGSAWIAAYTIIDGGNITTGTIDCSLVTIQSAGSGDRIVLNSSGIRVYGTSLHFYYSTTDMGGLYGGSSDLVLSANKNLVLASLNGYEVSIQSDDRIYMVTPAGYGVDMVSCDFMDLPRLSSAPTGAAGRLYYNSSDGKLYLYTTLSGTTKWWTFQMS